MNKYTLKPTRTRGAPKSTVTFRLSQAHIDHITVNGGPEYLRRLIDRDIIGLVARGESDHEPK